MSEEACRTRSQKRAFEPDLTEDDVESKKMKMERGPSELPVDGDSRVMPEPSAGPAQGLLRTTEAMGTGSGEGLLGDGPVDMRTSHSDMKSEKRPPSPDVIVLSDSEQPSSPRVNGLTTVALKDTSTEALLKSSPEERERMIKQLKEELRLEEAKLVLLKKLRQSQIQKEATAQKPTASSGSTVTTPPPLVRGPQNIPAGKPSLQTSSTRIPGSIIPPPLVRGGQQVSAKLGPQASSQVVMPPLVRGAQVSQVCVLGQDQGPSHSVACQGWLVSVAFLMPYLPADSQHQTAFLHGATTPPPGPPCLSAQHADSGTEDHPAGTHPGRQCPQHQSARQYPSGEART